MRVIPVIDLKRAAAVHAVRGDRERYRPQRSEIVAGSDPLRVAHAVREALALGGRVVSPDLARVGSGAEAGAAGALVATALHSGAIGPDDLRALG